MCNNEEEKKFFTKSLAKKALNVCKQFQEVKAEEQRLDHEARSAAYNYKVALKESKSAKRKMIASVVVMCVFILLSVIVWLISDSIILSIVVSIVAVITIILCISYSMDWKKATDKEMSRAADDYRLNSDKATAERNAYHKRAEELYSNVAIEFKELVDAYVDDENYVALYNFKDNCLTDIGCMADKILETFDKGLASNIPQAVQYLEAKRQNEALIKAHERTQAITAAAAQVNAAAAQVNAAASRASISAQRDIAAKNAESSADIKSTLDSVERQLKDINYKS